MLTQSSTGLTTLSLVLAFLVALCLLHGCADRPSGPDVAAPATKVRQTNMASPVLLDDDGRFRLLDGQAYLPLGGIHGNVIPVDMVDLSAEEIETLRAERKLWQGRYIDLVDASESVLKQWFALLQADGVNCLRLFPRVRVGREVLDFAGKVNPTFQANLSRVFATARPYGIRFQLMIIGEPGRSPYTQSRQRVESLVLPAYSEEELAALSPAQKAFLIDSKSVGREQFFTDPEVLACQKLFLRRACEWIATEPQVFSLEVYNEQGWWASKREGEQRGRVYSFAHEDAEIAWTAEIVKTIKQHLPDMPVTLSHPGFGVAGYEPLKWVKATGVDFYSTHMYANLCGGWKGTDFGAVTGATAAILNVGCVNFNGEWGVLDDNVDLEVRRRSHRDGIWLTLMAGAPGFLQWEHLLFEEYRWPNKVFAALPKGFSPARSAVAVDIAPAYETFQDNTRYPLWTDDAMPFAFPFNRQKQQDANLRAIFTAYMQSLQRGVPVRFVMGGGDGVLSLAQWADRGVDGLARPIQAIGGYQVAWIKDANSATYVAYLRSRKTERFTPVTETLDGQEVLTGGKYLGVPVPRPLTIKLDLPAGKYNVALIDLSLPTAKRQQVDAKAAIDVAAETDADYVLVITPADVELNLD